MYDYVLKNVSLLEIHNNPDYTTSPDEEDRSVSLHALLSQLERFCAKMGK